VKSPRISIYDTTLRDGAQGEGVSFSLSAKLRLAARLDEMGIDIVEGGYAGSNEKDMAFFRDVKTLSLRHARIAAFGSTRHARTRVQDDPLIQSLLLADTEVVTVYGKTWRRQVQKVLRTSLRENLAMIADTVGYLKERGKTVVFDAEHYYDGFTEAPEYALNCLEAAQAAGADTLALCETNGGRLPHEIAEITGRTRAALPRATLGFHGHNDAGLAVANSLEAVRAGVVQVHGTVNGYGERCGNANLCTLIPTLELKMGYACLAPGQLARMRELALFAEDLVNLRHDPKAPYVGQSAFSHKGGPHVNAVRKDRASYEHVAPEEVGNTRHVLVSELSGGSNVLLKAIEMGIGRRESTAGARDILKALKDMESQGYAFESADASFRMLIQKTLRKHKSFFELEGFRVIVEKRGKAEPCLSEATLKVRVGDEIEQTVAEGEGPVNALDGALRKALMRFYPHIAGVSLTDFRVSILDPEEATAAKTRVLIESTDGQSVWRTIGVSENIIEASWQALLDSVEFKLFKEEENSGPSVKRKRGQRT
jgi:2-isopropylmalate synthase